MKLSTKTQAALSLLVALGAASPAFADTLQGYTCDNRGNYEFVSPTSKDKHFVIPSINKVVNLVDAEANGPVGIVYDINPPQPFQFIQWYYKEAANSGALQGVTVKFCVQKQDGTGQTSYFIKGGTQDRGGSAGDGWSQVVQDNRGLVPPIVQNGKAYLTRLTFSFKDKGASNITLGAVKIQPGNIDVTNLNLDNGGCSLGDKCTKDAGN